MDKHLHGIVLNVIRALVVALAIVVLTSLATGWLYLMRGSVTHWPGPRVADALPLDELPGHDGVPLAAYVAACIVAGVMLGFVARALRLERLTAGLALSIGTGVWLLLADTFCLFVVRQVPAGAALQAAVRLQPVYIAAALAGAGGAGAAAVGRSRADPRLAPGRGGKSDAPAPAGSLGARPRAGRKVNR